MNLLTLKWKTQNNRGCGIVFLLMCLTLTACHSYTNPAEIANMDTSTILSLKVCPESPNCVCSQNTATSHSIEPVAFNGDGAVAIGRMASVIKSLPRSRVIFSDSRYLRAEFRSLLFRFVDDLEVLVDDSAPMLHIRSASRVGTSDFGVNRKRVEEIRRLFSVDS